MCPLPSRPVNREPEDNSGENAIESTPTAPEVAPAAPRLAAESEEVASFDEEEIARTLEETPIEDETFVIPAPASAKPVEAPVAAEQTHLPSAPPVAPQSRTEAPEVTPAPLVTPAPAQTPAIQVQEPAKASQPQAKVSELSETERLLASYSRGVKESITQLFEYITDDASSEVILNGPNEVGYKASGQRFFDNSINFGDVQTYHEVINHFILPLTTTKDRIGDESYLIQTQLKIADETNPGRPPLIARLHMVAPPVVPHAIITIAKKSRNQFTIDDLAQKGAMNDEMADFLKAIARGRATIIFSGSSGAGKTTLLEAVSREFDINDRIVLIEDTPELKLSVSDVVSLHAKQVKPNEDEKQAIHLDWLVRQANRMRADRIIVGEVGGGEMADFLTAANSGADGSMTTVHAATPQDAIKKMTSLSMKSATAKQESSILHDIAASVQIIIQMNLIDGKHVISQIEEVSGTVLNNGTSIATNPLYGYDRNTGQFVTIGRASEGFVAFLSQRGVSLPKPTSQPRAY